MAVLSFNNPEVQRLRRLIGSRSLRLQEGVFVLEGPKVLDEALSAGIVVETVFCEGGTSGQSQDRAVALGARHFSIAAETLRRIGDTQSPQSPVSIARWQPHSFDDLLQPVVAGGFVVVAENLQDPGNLGTIIRSSEAAGAEGVILCDNCVDHLSPKVVRSSAGALFNIKVIQAPSCVELVTALKQRQVRCLGSSSVLEGGLAPEVFDLTLPTAIFVGNEAHGLSQATLSGCDGLITIPSVGKTESLNAAMAATVMVFEAARQRRLIH